MIRKILFALVILGLAGCGTSEKSSDASSERLSGDTMTVDHHATASHEVEHPVERPPMDKKQVAQATNALNEAYKKNDDETLQRTASSLLAQNPTDSKALHALGVVNYKRGRFLAAMYYFNKAVQHNPQMAEAYTNIGLTQLALDDRREAIRAFKKAMELNSNDGIAAANLGAIYAQEGDYAKAQLALDRAVKAGLRDVRIYNNYGIALTGVGKYPEARDIYREAIKIDRNNRDVLFNYAILQIDHLNDMNGGLESLNQLRFLGLADGMRDRINALENKAKAGSNK